MSTTRAAAGLSRAADGYVHDVMSWSDHGAFVRATTDFVRGGLRSGEAVLVALPQPRLRAVRDALGVDASRVTFADMEGLGSNPARIISAWVELVARSGGQPMRGVGEPLWAGRTAVEVSECQLHEALLNDVIPATSPLWLRCPYEQGALPDQVVDEAIRTHPWVAEVGGGARSNEYYGGAQLGASGFSKPLPEPPEARITRTITAATLRSLRDLAQHVARVCGVSDDRTADLGLALHELGVNSVRHGKATERSGSGVPPRRWCARSATAASSPTR